jgi:hypothetical protein
MLEMLYIQQQQINNKVDTTTLLYSRTLESSKQDLFHFSKSVAYERQCALLRSHTSPTVGAQSAAFDLINVFTWQLWLAIITVAIVIACIQKCSKSCSNGYNNLFIKVDVSF